MTRSRDFAKGATRSEFDYTATAGQTTFTGNDNDSESLAYTAGQIDVYLNGSHLNVTDDYVATNGTSVVLQSGAQAGDSLVIVAYGSFNVANVVATRDLEGNEFILDDDGDTSITADTDDQIDIKIANTDHLILKGSSGDVVFQTATDAKDIKFNQYDGRTVLDINDTGYVGIANGATGSGELRIYEDTDNGTNYTGFKVGTQSGDIDYTLPTADGSNGQFLKTNGSGVLSFGTVSTTGAFTAFEYTATAAQTSFSGNDDNSNSLAYTSGVNNVFVTVNGVMLDGSDYTATNGTAVVLSAAAAANDMIKVLATNASSIATADADGAEFVLDADGDTSLTADTDDQIDIKIGGADDFRFTANTFTALSGSSIVVPAGGLTIGSTAVASTAAELNIVDGGTSATSTTVADADRVVLNDNGTMVQVAMTDIKTYIGGGTSWQAVKTSNFTAAAGQGVFCDTSSAAFTLTLPASPSIGDEVAFKDYAKTFDTNNLTIARNSSKIEGATNDLTVDVEGAGNTLVFTDSTQGWLLRNK